MPALLAADQAFSCILPGCPYLSSAQCPSEQIRQSRKPILESDEAKDQPVQGVPSCAIWKVAQTQFRIYEKDKSLMNNIVYIIGLIVIVLVVLSFLGLR